MPSLTIEWHRRGEVRDDLQRETLTETLPPAGTVNPLQRTVPPPNVPPLPADNERRERRDRLLDRHARRRRALPTFLDGDRCSLIVLPGPHRLARRRTSTRRSAGVFAPVLRVVGAATVRSRRDHGVRGVVVELPHRHPSAMPPPRRFQVVPPLIETNDPTSVAGIDDVCPTTGSSTIEFTGTSGSEPVTLAPVRAPPSVGLEGRAHDCPGSPAPNPA